MTGSCLADIELIKMLVTEAGKRALVVCGEVDCERKPDQTLVTTVDRELEEFLFDEIQRAFPDHAFLGEEFGFRGDPAAPLWACDPIDGTTNYVFGLSHWGVLLGLIQQGAPAMGAIYLPRQDELFWAVHGQGAYCNGERIHAEDRGILGPEDPLCLTSVPMKMLPIERFPGVIRSLGSIAAEVAYTARGNLCATIGRGESIVDVAAGLAIALEAGCEFRYLNGDPVDIAEFTRRTSAPAYDKPDFLMYGPPRTLDYITELLV